MEYLLEYGNWRAEIITFSKTYIQLYLQEFDTKVVLGYELFVPYLYWVRSAIIRQALAKTFILLTPHQFSIRIRTFLHSDQVPYISNCHRLAEFLKGFFFQQFKAIWFPFEIFARRVQGKRKTTAKLLPIWGKRVLSARNSHIHSWIRGVGDGDEVVGVAGERWTRDTAQQLGKHLANIVKNFKMKRLIETKGTWWQKFNRARPLRTAYQPRLRNICTATNTAPPFGLKQTLAILQAGGESNQRRIKNPTQSKTFPRFRKFREPSQIMGGYHQKVALWWWCKSWSDCGLCGCGKNLRIFALGKWI